MTDFIAAYPEVVYVVIGLMGLFIIYLWKGNEAKATQLIVDKLDTIVEKLNVLFTKDGERKAENKVLGDKISKLETELAKQIQRCDDRECP